VNLQDNYLLAINNKDPVSGKILSLCTGISASIFWILGEKQAEEEKGNMAI
jgi:hypothetical protein